MTTPEQKRAWYLANRELTLARVKTRKQLYPATKEQRLANRMQCLAKDPDFFKKANRRWYQRNLESQRLRGKLKARQWRKSNPQKVRDLSHRHKLRKRHARVDGLDCSEKIKSLIKEWFCRWCGIRLIPANWSIDHVIPLSRGGKHVPDNLVASCRTCNCSKSDKLIEEWEWKLA